MSVLRKVQDINIEPLKISYIGSRQVISEKNKNDLLWTQPQWEQSEPELIAANELHRWQKKLKFRGR